MNKEFCDKLEKRIQKRYNNIDIEILGKKDDYILYVYFNDSSDNCLAIYEDKKGFKIANFLYSRSKTFKSTTEYVKKINGKTIEEILVFFHKCYKCLCIKEQEWIKECKDCLKENNIDENMYEKIYGPRQNIGEK